MKNLKQGLLITAGTFVLMMLTVLSCQKTENSESTKSSSELQLKSTPAVYALAMSGSSGTPVSAGFRSAIYTVNLCSSPITYSFVSLIQIGSTPVTGVTGICDMPNTTDSAWVVTGKNSNFPQRLLGVQISTGKASIVSVTTVPLQDIENYYSTGIFVAIQEGTSQLMIVSVPGGVCTAFAPIGPVEQYNGLTVVGENFQTISGATDLICSSQAGDIFEYPSTGGSYIGKYSYKNLSVSSIWTEPELGFYYDNYCSKQWVIGSASGIISYNTDITPCISPNPTFLYSTIAGSAKYPYIYDFMIKQ
jgi:hypothetical protein